MAGQERSDFLGVGSIEFAEKAIRRRVVDLGLNKVDKTREIRSTGVMDDSVDTKARVRATGNGVVTANFTLVKIVSFRQSTQIGRAVAADVILHTFDRSVPDSMMKSGEGRRVGRTTA
jgi:hypothetical protein